MGYHPKMKKDDYQPSLQKLLKLIREQGASTPVVPDPEVEEKIVEKSKSKLGLRASMTPPTKFSPCGELTPAQLRAKLKYDKRESCKTPGCGYRTSNAEKMA